MFNFWRKPQPEPMPQPPARSPEEYEALLRQLLERVGGNDGRANGQAFLIIQKVKADWLERFGQG